MGALEGITVIDHTASFWASVGTAMLADFGANVSRTVPSSLSVHESALAHRNKHDLSSKCDEEVHELRRNPRTFSRLICRSGELEAAGLDYATRSAKNPALIYACGSGFGPDGPDRDLPALDELAAARTGMMPILPQPGEPPVYPGSGQMYSSVMLAFGVMLALHHREETGEGQRVDVSLFAGNMYGASLDIQAYLAIGGERFLHPISRLDAGNPMSGPSYPTADGRWVTLTMPDTDRYWPALRPHRRPRPG